MILTVKVSPGARQTALKRYENGILYVSIAAAPEKGQANEALIEFLAETFKIPKNSVELMTGAMGKLKRIRLPVPETSVQAFCRAQPN